MASLLLLEAGRFADVLESPSARPLADLLRGVRPKVEQLFRQYSLPPDQANEILNDTVSTLVWRWETVRDRENWLLAILACKCRTATGRRFAEVEDGW